MINKILLPALISFSATVLLTPLVIYFSKKFKANQTILHYVEEHKGKAGTPTMGGFAFVIVIFVFAFAIFSDLFLAKFTAIITLAFCILGFMDDFIKIKLKKNEGLRPYQKVISQFAIATVIAFFAYFSPLVGSKILIPFTDIYINLGWGIIPLIIVFFIAVTNSVNLIDGLDGLASGVSGAFLLGIGTFVLTKSEIFKGAEFTSLTILCFVAVGALVGFLCFNVFPAKIFMGDTGSLALGGLIASICVFLRMELFIFLGGIMFVLTALSDIIQVLYYKKTKKRVFLMAPLHHHFQKKGINENRITFIYFIITLAISFLMILVG